MARLRRATLREIQRYGRAARQGPGDPIARRTLFPSGTNVNAPTTDVTRLTAWRQLNTTIATTFTGVGMANPATSGTPSIAHDATGRWIDYDTGNVINSNAGWTIPGAINETELQFRPEATIIVRTGSDITNVRIWVGWFSGDPMASDTAGTGAGGNVIAFRFSTNASDSTWQSYTEDGANNNTVKNTNTTVSASTIYRLRPKVVSTSMVEFYINDVKVTAHTETLPGATAGLAIVAAIRNLVAGPPSRHFQISRMNFTEATAG